MSLLSGAQKVINRYKLQVGSESRFQPDFDAFVGWVSAAQNRLANPDLVRPFISQEDVDGFRKVAKERSVFKGYAIVQVDDEAVKGGLLTGVEFEELQKLLKKMEALSSYVAVKRVTNDEKDEITRLTRIENKVQQLIRKAYMDHIDARLEPYKKNKDERQSAFEARILGNNREELMEDLKANSRKAFEFLGLEYDVAMFYKMAEREVNATEMARANKYALKVLSRPTEAKGPDRDNGPASEAASSLKDAA